VCSKTWEKELKKKAKKNKRGLGGGWEKPVWGGGGVKMDRWGGRNGRNGLDGGGVGCGRATWVSRLVWENHYRIARTKKKGSTPKTKKNRKPRPKKKNRKKNKSTKKKRKKSN